MKKVQRIGILVVLLMVVTLAAWAWQTSKTFTVNVPRGQRLGACEVFGSSRSGATFLSGGMWFANCTDGEYKNPATGLSWTKLSDTTVRVTVRFPDDGKIVLEGGYNPLGIVKPQIQSYKLDEHFAEVPTN